MAVRSNRLAGPVSVSGSASVFTVPAGRTAIVKQISIVNFGAGSSTVTLYLNGTASGDALDRRSVGAGTTFHVIDIWWVFEPGDVMWVGASAAATVSVHGALLEGAPS